MRHLVKVGKTNPIQTQSKPISKEFPNVEVEVEDPAFRGRNQSQFQRSFPMSKSKIRHLFDGIRPSVDGIRPSVDGTKIRPSVDGIKANPHACPGKHHQV